MLSSILVIALFGCGGGDSTSESDDAGAAGSTAADDQAKADVIPEIRYYVLSEQ